jgi:hypothetical protein
MRPGKAHLDLARIALVASTGLLAACGGREQTDEFGASCDSSSPSSGSLESSGTLGSGAATGASGGGGSGSSTGSSGHLGSALQGTSGGGSAIDGGSSGAPEAGCTPPGPDASTCNPCSSDPLFRCVPGDAWLTITCIPFDNSRIPANLPDP